MSGSRSGRPAGSSRENEELFAAFEGGFGVSGEGFNGEICADKGGVDVDDLRQLFEQWQKEATGVSEVDVTSSEVLSVLAARGRGKSISARLAGDERLVPLTLGTALRTWTEIVVGEDSRTWRVRETPTSISVWWPDEGPPEDDEPEARSWLEDPEERDRLLLETCSFAADQRDTRVLNSAWALLHDGDGVLLGRSSVLHLSKVLLEGLGVVDLHTDNGSEPVDISGLRSLTFEIG